MAAMRDFGNMHGLRMDFGAMFPGLLSRADYASAVVAKSTKFLSSLVGSPVQRRRQKGKPPGPTAQERPATPTGQGRPRRRRKNKKAATPRQATGVARV